MYSKELIHTIFECLYEVPCYRLDLEELKLRIAVWFRTLGPERLMADAEPWEDFLEPPVDEEGERPAKRKKTDFNTGKDTT